MFALCLDVIMYYRYAFTKKWSRLRYIKCPPIFIKTSADTSELISHTHCHKWVERHYDAMIKRRNSLVVRLALPSNEGATVIVTEYRFTIVTITIIRYILQCNNGNVITCWNCLSFRLYALVKRILRMDFIVILLGLSWSTSFA